MEYPKVCWVCSMPHIRSKKEEKIIVVNEEGDTSSVHVNCDGKPVYSQDINGCYTDNRILYGLKEAS